MDDTIWNPARPWRLCQPVPLAPGAREKTDLGFPPHLPTADDWLASTWRSLGRIVPAGYAHRRAAEPIFWSS